MFVTNGVGFAQPQVMHVQKLMGGPSEPTVHLPSALPRLSNACAAPAPTLSYMPFVPLRAALPARFSTNARSSWPLMGHKPGVEPSHVSDDEETEVDRLDETAQEPVPNRKTLLPLPKEIHIPKAVPDTLHRIENGVHQLGDTVGHMFSRTSDGNEMTLTVVDHLKDCYPSCPVGLTKYKVDHDDFTGKRTLHVNTEFVEDDYSLYHRLMRDTVYAQWVDVTGDGDLELHIQMHLTENREGPGPAWEHWLREQSGLPKHLIDEVVSIGGEMRKQVFKAHVEDAVEVIFTSVRELLNVSPELHDAPLRIQYLSNIESLNEDQASGTVGDWLERIDGIIEEGESRVLLDALAKNIDVWKDATKSAQKALNRFGNMIIKECMNPKVVQMLNEVRAQGGLEVVAILIILAFDQFSER